MTESRSTDNDHRKGRLHESAHPTRPSFDLEVAGLGHGQHRQRRRILQTSSNSRDYSPEPPGQVETGLGGGDIFRWTPLFDPNTVKNRADLVEKTTTPTDPAKLFEAESTQSLLGLTAKATSQMEPEERDLFRQLVLDQIHPASRNLGDSLKSPHPPQSPPRTGRPDPSQPLQPRRRGEA